MDNNFVYFIVSGFFILILPIVFIGNFWLKGFFWSFVKVKGSSGKLVLIRVRSRMRDYFRPGFVIDNVVKFKDSSKNSRTIALPKNNNFIYRAYGVNNIDIDEEKNCVFLLDGSAVTGFDAEKFDDMLLKALMKPVVDNKTLIIIILLIVCLLIGIASIGLGFKNYQMLQAMGSTVKSTVTSGLG